MDIKDMSLSLYHHMCKHLVGTENHVKTIRLMNAVCDDLLSGIPSVTITSGSFGEGLQMLGSDLDIMAVLKYIEVHETIASNAFDPMKTHFALMTEDTKPGFAMLRLISSPHPPMRKSCEIFRRDNYLSNVLFKNFFSAGLIIHGPCVSDKEGLFDFASCLHSKYWVTSALQWTMRSHNSWPDENTMQMIINHGVLFVPIGSKGSPHEELEWRMSFSVGEKFLIYTFNHTQLLCYALMKILLKDVINTDSRCTDLLCSYYMKTILFWISEEFEPSVWTPDNLIPCFMRCFRRLIYSVEYQVFPHYFIPENNLFENKIEGLGRSNLKDALRVLQSYGWRCITFSKQISYVSILSFSVPNDQSFFYYEDIDKFLNSKIVARVTCVNGELNNLSKAIYNITTYNSKKLKYLHVFFMSVVCNRRCQYVRLSGINCNKNQYKQYNTCLSYLLMSIHHDSVSGWLMLASFFYKTNQYKKSLIIIVYALSKCTLDTLYLFTVVSVRQNLLAKWHFEQKQGLMRSIKFVLADHVNCVTSLFIPKELLIDGGKQKIPPKVYAHFLSFLCHFRQNNERECRNSLKDLQSTIAKDYFIGQHSVFQPSTYYCLGTALQLMGDNVSAKQAFTETLRFPSNIRSLNRP
ncbi:uncharacterized protein LOC127715971 [Mytilus californianus]|uniref:uncharacterized protein LOC127715971 n=1 Tax=Mytilus californianus TaxID=6549 RepID=UPI002245919F|nr:uncharacterized protein LOC127715971 [Mytilus californianus]